MCGSYFYRQHILRVQFFGVIKWPVLCVPGIPLTAFWANTVKKAHKTSKLFNLRGFQVSLSELFHIAFCYFPFRFLPSPYKTPQNQKNKETTKHTKKTLKKIWDPHPRDLQGRSKETAWTGDVLGFVHHWAAVLHGCYVCLIYDLTWNSTPPPHDSKLHPGNCYYPPPKLHPGNCYYPPRDPPPKKRKKHKETVHAKLNSTLLKHT